MVKPRRILYVATTAEGGSAFSLYHLVKGLDKKQYLPTVLFFSGHPYIAGKLAELGVETIVLDAPADKQTGQAGANGEAQREEEVEGGRQQGGLSGRLEARFGRAAAQAFQSLKACYEFIRRDIPRIWPVVKIIRKNRIDLVHLNNGLRRCKPGLVAAWLAGRPSVCHVRIFYQLNSFDKLFIRLVNSFIYISRAIAEDCTGQGIPADKGLIVHNAVDFGEFSKEYDPEPVRQEFGWLAGERLVGVVGRLDWWKGHEYFLQALAQVGQQIPHVRGLIIGAAESSPQNQAYFQKLKALVKTLELEDKVIFTGFRSDIPCLTAALDVVVLSSATPEPFGRVVIEGMAAGKPVVATAAGGVLDIIEDRVNGLLVPCRDSKAMAGAISWLLLNQRQADQIGQSARQHVMEKFTIKQHAATIQGIYNTVLENSPGYLAAYEPGRSN